MYKLINIGRDLVDEDTKIHDFHSKVLHQDLSKRLYRGSR